MDSILNHASDPLSPDRIAQRRIEDLGLSLRTRRALRRFGCATIGDVLRLNLDGPIRGLGKKSKEELLARIEDAGLPHRGNRPRTEIARLEQNLKRVQRHIEAVLGIATRELRAAQEQIDKLKARSLHLAA